MAWGWSKGSVVKSTFCFSKRPKFSSQHPHRTAQNYLPLQLPRIRHPFLTSVSTHTQTKTKDKTLKHAWQWRTLERESIVRIRCQEYVSSSRLPPLLCHCYYFSAFCVRQQNQSRHRLVAVGVSLYTVFSSQPLSILTDSRPPWWYCSGTG